MARWPKPAEGSWTEHFGLGTEPISYEDSISPEFYELEREAVFKRAWLNVGRVEQLPRTGSYFTKELAVARTSVIVVRGKDGEVRAFHNVCRHRGNKLVWNDYPQGGDERRLPPVRVQVPRLALRPRRLVELRAAGAGVLRPRQGRLRPRPGALRGLGRLHLREPGQGARAEPARLPRADGDQAGELPVRRAERALVLPRHRRQQLEDLHGRLPGVLPRTGFAREADAARLVDGRAAGGFRGARLHDRRSRTGWSAPRGSTRGRSTPRCSSRWSC